MPQKKTDKKAVPATLGATSDHAESLAGKDPTPRYSRAQALADGAQVEVTEMGREAGILWRVFLTRAVYDAYVIVPPKCKQPQDEAGRLWDILWMARYAIVSKKGSGERRQYSLTVRTIHGRRVVDLVVVKSILDFDDFRPVLVIMLPGEAGEL